MGDTAEQVDLPGLASLDQSLLGLVAELGGEDGVDLCGDSLISVCSNQVTFGRYLPAAAIEKGP